MSTLDKLSIIMETVAEYTGVSERAMKQKPKPLRVTYARQLYCVLCRMFTKEHDEKIAARLLKDRTIVTYSMHKIKDLSDTEEQVKEDVKILSDKIEKRFA